MPTSDHDLLNRAIQGDRDALRTLLKQYAPMVRRGVAAELPRRWRRLVSVDDVMQQTYADAIQAVGRFVPMGEGSFGAWLASLARCNLHDAVKALEADKRGGSRRQIDVVRSGDSYVTLLTLLSSSGTTPSRQVAADEARAALEQAIQQLPETYRVVVQRWDLAGESVKSIAEFLNRSPGAVYMLRARAHDRLRTNLGATGKYFTDSP